MGKTDMIYKDPALRSSVLVNGNMAGPRAHLRGMGMTSGEMAKPFIGVVNTFNELHPGHVHLNRLGQFVKDGVREAGGIPFEVNTISICDGFTLGHPGMCSVLPSREVIADSVELFANAYALDGLVLLAGCDKIVPAMIMAALRVNIPTIIVTGGPMMPGEYKGKQYATYELKEMVAQMKRGEISPEEYEYMEGLMSPGPGSCAMMGTANTFSIVAEALGPHDAGKRLRPCGQRQEEPRGQAQRSADHGACAQQSAPARYRDPEDAGARRACGALRGRLHQHVPAFPGDCP